MLIGLTRISANAGWSTASLFILVFRCALYGQTDSIEYSLTDGARDPKVIILLNGNMATHRLDRYKAGSGDSCVEVVLRIKKPYCVDVGFNWSSGRRWLFDTVAVCEKTAKPPPVYADVSVDDSGFLKSMSLVFGKVSDSIKVFLDTGRNVEIRKMPNDSFPPDIEFELRRTAYVCVERTSSNIVIHRKFTYPAGCMRREPVYNYPELSMFHCGISVRMPSSRSVFKRGTYIFEGRTLHPPPLIYNEEESRYIDDKKPAAKPKKPGFLKFRPL